MAASASASAAIILVPTPSAQTLVEGGFATIDVQISGLGAGEAPSLGTYDLEVTFNPTVLDFVSATLGDGVLGNQLDLFDLGNVSSVTPSTGVVNLFELSLDTATDLNTLQADSFVLASLRFSSLSEGMSTIGLSVNSLGDADGAPLAVSLLSGSVVVTAVPEPKAFALVLAGIVLIGGVARKRPAGGQLQIPFWLTAKR
jgi:hypothetical protein